MIKDILVHIPTERSARPVIDGSISLAAKFGAQVDALAVSYITAGTSYIMEGGVAMAAVLKLERERALERAKATLETFETEAKNAGVSYSCRALDATPAEATATAGGAAKLYDLNVVLQPDNNRATFDNTLPLEILFQAGGPVLFLPHIFTGAFKTGRIGICWDGSRVAARALRDASPFLEQAEQLIIVTVNEADSLASEVSSENLAKHLSRQGLSSRTVLLSGPRSQIQPMILSLAADESLDMLVMGGYGHSRLQEAFLGGVTRGMIESMTVPTLMAH